METELKKQQDRNKTIEEQNVQLQQVISSQTKIQQNIHDAELSLQAIKNETQAKRDCLLALDKLLENRSKALQMLSAKFNSCSELIVGVQRTFEE